MEQVIKIFPSSLTRDKLTAFPQRYCWPVYNDQSGAAMLIDAVMDRNLGAIDAAIMRFPEFDLGLDAFRSGLAGKYRKTDTVEVKPLSCVRYANGINCKIVLECNRTTRITNILATITRGDRVLARKILATKKV